MFQTTTNIYVSIWSEDVFLAGCDKTTPWNFQLKFWKEARAIEILEQMRRFLEQSDGHIGCNPIFKMQQ